MGEDSKETVRDKLVHTIMMLNVSIKEVKGFTKSTLYLVDLAASNRHIKSKKETQLFTEHTIVSEQYNTFLKVLQSLSSGVPPPYSESHLTRALKDLLSTRSKLFFIGHIVQNESAYEETLHTLLYMHKCKCFETGGGARADSEGLSTAARERMLRKINQENSDLKVRLERLKRVHTVLIPTE